MIHVMQSMLVSSIREGETGHEVMAPVNLMWVSDQLRPGSGDVDFRLQCIAVVYVRGGAADELITAGGFIKGPDVPSTRLPEKVVRWRGRSRVMDLVMAIDVPVKLAGGGLYHIAIDINRRPAASLPFFLVWKSEEQAPIP
jgi:hypothetical protein